MNKKVLVFAGTKEGKDISEFLSNAGVDVLASVATEHGAMQFIPQNNLKISSGKLEKAEKCKLMKEYSVVVDATHPYAVTISEHIREACSESGAEYIRIIRPKSMIDEKIICVPDIDSAVDYLKNTTGNVLVTIGSKEIHKFTSIENYKERIFARVLSIPSVSSSCAKHGFEGKNLIAMQGPYCEELNYGLLKQVNAKYLVTKDSGESGGFDDKISAARKTGTNVIVIGRPDESGQSYEDVLKILCDKFSIKYENNTRKKNLTLVGVGMGPLSGPTIEVLESIAKADLICGAKRMIESINIQDKEILYEYIPSKVIEYMNNNPKFMNIVVLFSGDVGFYSGAKSFLENVDRSIYDVNIKCGITSVSYMCSKLNVPWQDVHLVSVHGKDHNIIGEIKRHAKVFALTDVKNTPSKLCKELKEYGMENVTITVASNMGYPNEEIVTGTPSELCKREFDSLCTMIILNPNPDVRIPISISDEDFIRGDVPMTKSEVRALSVAKMKLSDDSIIYDVGAGTGSVSIEMALCSVNGTVYSIEKNETAADFIEINKKKFCVSNLEVVRGLAPAVLLDLPAPTHVFIGGSSGNLKEIIEVIIAKNPNVRIIANAITLETLSEIIECSKSLDIEQEEIVCINVSKSKEVGNYNLMMSQNPVYITVWENKK